MDAHAKNHSLLLVAPDDIRLAPLYDVASIAPYRSLAPSARKPPRTALSIGGENRFGMLKKKHVENIADAIGLKVARAIQILRELIAAWTAQAEGQARNREYRLSE